MGLTIKPIECHGGCLGCYEKETRESGFAPQFDYNAVLKSLKQNMEKDKKCSWNSPTLHGGEPLLLPITEIEGILATIFEKYGRSGIQTSGALITSVHIDLFKKYKTSVGVSIDGDEAGTNFGRWNAAKFDPARMTEKTLSAMYKMRSADIPLSVIVLLRRYNAETQALRQNLVRFGLRLRDDFGITDVRFNPVIGFDERTIIEEELDNKSLFDTFKLLATCSITENLSWRPILDFINALDGDPQLCQLNECDLWHTEAEIPILGDGSLGVCLKGGGGANGIATLRTDEKSIARYEMLPQIPQENGGCAGCYWWPCCKGGCPGAGINGDWRNRTRFCEAYKETFSFLSSLPLFSCKRNKPTETSTHGDKAHGDSNDPEWRKANPWWKGQYK